MTFEEAVCWSFNVVPSQLPQVYWSNTRLDLKTKLRLRVGEEAAKLLHGFENFVETVSMALGGKKSKGKAIDSAEEARFKFAKVFGQ